MKETSYRIRYKDDPSRPNPTLLFMVLLTPCSTTVQSFVPGRVRPKTHDEMSQIYNRIATPQYLSDYT